MAYPVYRIKKGAPWPEGISDGLTLPCRDCGRVPEIDFQVADQIWRRVATPEMKADVLCLRCFTQRAELDGIDVFSDFGVMHVHHRGQTIVLAPQAVYDLREKIRERVEDQPTEPPQRKAG